MNLDYVLKIPWDNSQCRNYHNPNSPSTGKTSCCQTLLSLYGVAFSQHLKKTSLFQLPDLPSSISCLQDFQSKLTSLSLPSNLTNYCFTPSQFVIAPNICASIQSTQDWSKKLGNSTALDSCKPDLTDLTSCDACVAAGFRVQTDLISIDGNKSHSTDCFYFTVLYAAGIVNDFGPESLGSVSCIFGLSISSSNKGSAETACVDRFGLIGACVAVFVMCGLLGLYLWWNRKCRKKNGVEGEEELGFRPRRPTTVSIWYKIQELEKATDGFSPKNFIGRGGFGLVYKGTLADGTVVAVKKIIESDIEGNAEFCNEVEIISNLKHRNLVPLRGCCVAENGCLGDSERYLVYDYMPNGNLDNHLFPIGSNGNSVLSWPQRKSIILDVAKGLAYLHYGVKPAIYHRDIKANEHIVGRFGVVVLEIMCGRKALDLSSGSPRSFLITDWAWSLVKAGKIEKVLDASLMNGGDSSNANPKGIMERFVHVGILCAHVMVALRPTIADALKMLEGDIEVPTIPDRPTPLGHPSFYRGDNNNTFSISPALSALQLHSGDMLR
ncbi:hypothetical protein DH2020_044904 [Rehmannia glutinosa]|uniref:Protein kinase domain-containing protein n=1 Tax=Rehmannia glutinosa TaxID=99300 RepID=A0ABR0UGA2_REHGL